MTTAIPQNVVHVDDRAGNHYWIFTVSHVTGTVTTINVDNSCAGASEIQAAITRSGDITVADADATNDFVKEVTIASGETTGIKTIIARFVGSAAGSSSSKIDS